MRLATFTLAIAVATSAALVVSGQAPMPVETSDLLTHSPLVTCGANPRPPATRSSHARVATWNIRAARSASVSAIADELRAMQADVIALQEVDVRVRRTGFVDEPTALATALDFQYVFAAAIKWDQGDYGLAVLSRWPLTDVKRYRLDATAAEEPRIVLEATICAGGRALHVFNHHADGRVAARDTGFAQLKRIVQARLGGGLLVLGDFNEPIEGPGIHGLLEAGLVDVGNDHDLGTSGNRRIDYLLADAPFARRATTAHVWPTDKSDHNAVLADLEW